jgi:hypothetical protein
LKTFLSSSTADDPVGLAALIKAARAGLMSRPKADFTTHPEPPPPSLLCPKCDRPLVYRLTVLNGIKPRERWDYFECLTCGPVEYRERTHTVRLIDFRPTPPKDSAA